MKKGGVRLSPLRAFPNHHLPICRSSELIHTRRSSLSLPSREFKAAVGLRKEEGGGGRRGGGRREGRGGGGGRGRGRREREREREREKERERETDTETEQTKGATHATGQQHKHTLTSLTK